MFNHQDQTFTLDFFMPYKMTSTAMAKRFFRSVIDDGRNLSEITNVEFIIGEEDICGASDALFLYRLFSTGRLGSPVHRERRPLGR
jgi:hypothetical protein